jgi:hypothetical protein
MAGSLKSLGGGALFSSDGLTQQRAECHPHFQISASTKKARIVEGMAGLSGSGISWPEINPFRPDNAGDGKGFLAKEKARRGRGSGPSWLSEDGQARRNRGSPGRIMHWDGNTFRSKETRRRGLHRRAWGVDGGLRPRTRPSE